MEVAWQYAPNTAAAMSVFTMHQPGTGQLLYQDRLIIIYTCPPTPKSGTVIGTIPCTKQDSGIMEHFEFAFQGQRVVQCTSHKHSSLAHPYILHHMTILGHYCCLVILTNEVHCLSGNSWAHGNNYFVTWNEPVIWMLRTEQLICHQAHHTVWRVWSGDLNLKWSCAQWSTV